MSASATTPASLRGGVRQETLVAGLIVFGVLELGLAVFMAFSPRSFFTSIGPFGTLNTHYVRDVASFEGALGAALLIAVRRPAWRVPVLAVTTMQFALHSLNHLIDIAAAHPAWAGYFDFLSLAGSTAILIWLWREASRDAARQAAAANRNRPR